MKALTIPLALLAACNRQAEAPPANDTAPAPAVKPAAPAPKAFVHDEKSDLIEFHYAWSVEAAAVPQLVARFRKDMEKAKAELIADAREDKAFREKQGFDFNGHNLSTDYRTAGQSTRLLSLSADSGSYTGGAHGNYGTRGLLWDRQAAREIKVADLFFAPSNLDRLLTQRWCDELNEAREEKRGEPVGGDAMFDECPTLDQIAIIPTDDRGNGRFEMLVLVASPYVAGPYAEGSYDIELKVTPELIAALKIDYRASFEVQPQ
ncbi:MAG: DUF4163 domain-containing protein [Pseudomonadota bacterium]|nr:DUF4163 domain-containing protein [Pseudomonadota bacterium]